MKPWKWRKQYDSYGVGWVLLDGRDRTRANVWGNGVWHTYDVGGVGGENDVCQNIQDARDQVIAAVVRQGWTPFKILE